jgi:hypothetical protein
VGLSRGAAEVCGLGRDVLAASVGCRAGRAGPVRSRLGLSREPPVGVRRSVVGSFEEVHAERVIGSLAMFDRMIFKGHLTALFKKDGARCFLWTQGVALRDFAPYVKATTARIAENAQALAVAAGRPVIYFEHARIGHRDQRKDDLARSIATRDGITEGVICLIKAMQPCRSFQVSKYADSGRLEIRSRERKCLHHYLYLIDPEFGFMHVYIQGWMPWEIGIYINGREWLARQLDKAGIGYLRHDNALLRIDDIEAAARLRSVRA